MNNEVFPLFQPFYSAWCVLFSVNWSPVNSPSRFNLCPVFVCIYVYICICVYIYICVYICISRQIKKHRSLPTSPSNCLLWRSLPLLLTSARCNWWRSRPQPGLPGIIITTKNYPKKRGYYLPLSSTFQSSSISKTKPMYHIYNNVFRDSTDVNHFYFIILSR